MDTPSTCCRCGFEDFDGAAFCTHCGRRMLSPAWVRSSGRFMMGVSVLGLAVTGGLPFLFFGESNKTYSVAGAAFLIMLNVWLAGMCVAYMIAGWWQAKHGRRNRFVHWVLTWLCGPANPHG